MANALFISETYLKNTAPITANVDVQLFLPFIEVAQSKWIRDVLGNKLYQKLVDGIINSTLSTDESDLLKDFIRPIVAWYVVFEALPYLNAKIRNKSVLKGSTGAETLQPVDLEELKYLRNEAKNNGEFYMKKLQDWLCLNGKNFPEYTNPDTLKTPNYRAGFECDLGFDRFDEHYLDIEFFRRYLQ